MKVLRFRIIHIFVINKYRYLTSNPNDTVGIMREIETAAGAKFTSIVNNSNLGEESGLCSHWREGGDALSAQVWCVEIWLGEAFEGLSWPDNRNVCVEIWALADVLFWWCRNPDVLGRFCFGGVDYCAEIHGWLSAHQPTSFLSRFGCYFVGCCTLFGGFFGRTYQPQRPRTQPLLHRWRVESWKLKVENWELRQMRVSESRDCLQAMPSRSILEQASAWSIENWEFWGLLFRSPLLFTPITLSTPITPTTPIKAPKLPKFPTLPSLKIGRETFIYHKKLHPSWSCHKNCNKRKL